jgi:hypothetical protein
MQGIEPIRPKCTDNENPVLYSHRGQPSTISGTRALGTDDEPLSASGTLRLLKPPLPGSDPKAELITVRVITPTVDPVTREINVWASVVHHQMAGGIGCPSFDRCGIKADLVADPSLSEPSAIESRALVWDLGRADQLYEASFRKYRPSGTVGPTNDRRTELSALLVEQALKDAGYPPLLLGLLLWLYPTDGDFCIQRPKNWDPDNPYRSYRPRKWVLESFGSVTHRYLDRTVDRLLHDVESGFRRSLAKMMKGGVER